MDPDVVTRPRALSRKEYLDTLQPPTLSERKRITERQIENESAISAKYSSIEDHIAAKIIQRTYRGHRERRQLNGLTLDPSSRWVELIRELRYRSAIAPHYTATTRKRTDTASSSEQAKLNWRRAGHIAEHAGAGESNPSLPLTAPSTTWKGKEALKDSGPSGSLLLDIRYFLEMVDVKHRYGANLLVYHEEWQRTRTTENFFYWLDHGKGRDVDLSACPRAKLEKEQIRYLSREERQDYLVKIDDQGLMRWAKNDKLITTSVEKYQDSMQGIVPKGSTAPTFNDEDTQQHRSSLSEKLSSVGSVFKDALTTHEFDSDPNADPSSDSSISSLDDHHAHNISELEKKHQTPKKKRTYVSPATILNRLLRASVRPGTWIYVADTVGRLYVGIKSSGTFQHASFLSGARISSAGSIGIEDGQLTYLSPLSGHYRPTTRSFRVFVGALKGQGADISGLKVSNAYAVLLGMEVYGKSKKELLKLMHPDREKRKGAKGKLKEAKQAWNLEAVDESPKAPAEARKHSNQEHHRTELVKLMNELRLQKVEK